MIKKRILSISAIFSIFILSKLYSTPNNDPIESPYKQVMLDHAKRLKNERVDANLKNETGVDFNSLTFADEVVPTHRSSVKAKLGKHISKFSYKKMQSNDMHKKANTYLPQIAEILESYGIPEDFKYIPVVESGFNPRVKSHKGAGGYWQFMPATARLYGLKVNGKVDERKDLVKSTHAAAKYIKSLYDEFGDWTLVAAAYNLGGNRLKSSIRNQKQKDYYRLRLNNETASYVYKLVSVKTVIENPEYFGYNI